MTKYQKLEKAKNDSLKKWEKIAVRETDWPIGCGFCDAYGGTSSPSGCYNCPVDKDCQIFYTKNHQNRDITSFALAVMVYIHGFTVADLPD